jgi:hypothetical protein
MTEVFLTSNNLTAPQKAKDLIEKFGREVALDVTQELFNETDWAYAPFWDEVMQEIKLAIKESRK